MTQAPSSPASPPASGGPFARALLARARRLGGRPAVWLALLAVAAGGGALTRLPLFEVPGYELSAALTLALALLVGPLGIFMARRERAAFGASSAEGAEERPGTSTRTLLLNAGATGLLGLAALLPPFLAALLGALFGSGCSPWSGAGFYLLLPLPTLALASTVGVLLGFATRRAGPALGLYFLGLLGTLAVSLWPLWSGPQIFALHHLLGYFPGPLYDEALAVDSRLLAFRALTLLWTALLLATGAALLDPRQLRLRLAGARKPVLLLSAVLAAGVALFWVFDARLGLQTRDADLERDLGGKLETAHFVLHFPRTKPRDEAEQLGRELEFQYAQVTAFLGAEHSGKIRAWFHRGPAEKRRLVGAARTNFAKPWRGEFHVHDEPFPHPVSRHEMAHVIAASFGSPLFGVSAKSLVWVNAGLVEGLAVAADNPADELTLHQWAAAMRKLKLAPDIRRIVAPTGFWAEAPQRAYTLAGSFLRFLSETYGAANLRALYPAGDFEAAYGRSLDALAAEWEASLDALSLDGPALHVAQVRFERPSLFARPCAREVATLREEADRLRQADPERALANYRRCAEIDPGHAGHLRAEAELLREQQDTDGARQVWQTILSGYGHDGGTRALALMALGDLAWEQGELDEASARFREVYALHRDQGSDRTALVKLEAIARGDGHEVMRRFFARAADLPEVLALKDLLNDDPGYAAPQYLIGRQLFQRRDFEGAAHYLGRAREAGLKDAELRRENLRLLTRAGFQSGNLDAAKAALGALQAEGTDADRAFAADWQARCDFEAQSSPRARTGTAPLLPPRLPSGRR